MKIFNIIILILAIIIVIVVGGYFVARYSINENGPEYLFEHPTIAKYFNLSPVCPTICDANGGVCGKDGKTYCNECVAFQHGAGVAYEGICLKTYINQNYGFSINFPASWNNYSVVISSWNGQLINKPHTQYKGVELIFKNPQTTSSQAWQDIPIMIVTPDVWKMMSGSNPTIAVSAAPVGPGEIGENPKYVFATPPRWNGFSGESGAQEALNIVATFKAFEIK